MSSSRRTHAEARGIAEARKRKLGEVAILLISPRLCVIALRDPRIFSGPTEMLPQRDKEIGQC